MYPLEVQLSIRRNILGQETNERYADIFQNDCLWASSFNFLYSLINRAIVAIWFCNGSFFGMLYYGV